MVTGEDGAEGQEGEDGEFDEHGWGGHQSTEGHIMGIVTLSGDSLENVANLDGVNKLEEMKSGVFT